MARNKISHDELLTEVAVSGSHRLTFHHVSRGMHPSCTAMGRAVQAVALRKRDWAFGNLYDPHGAIYIGSKETGWRRHVTSLASEGTVFARGRHIQLLHLDAQLCGKRLSSLFDFGAQMYLVLLTAISMGIMYRSISRQSRNRQPLGVVYSIWLLLCHRCSL